ncbi:TetR/AcrR family transcriptional regulator [Pseudonocardia humida]|uniref:TetR/AcrR family transcriptional regulator n=1 Tax=Pseudonocardia humida TaxID=2800819 RepID=A0ABT1A820_9PSEU|nr:TetR/AcrR family transcriptional regulator [Pseudonocardia humida]MCO1659167.1 TetR/AcrR family transcriptional regulator [Pseudonocardia humida]
MTETTTHPPIPRLPELAPEPPPAGDPAGRAARTRTAIIDATRALFLERGYAGTRISDITAACGISRAGFYNYFKDKRDVFILLGSAAFRELLDVVARWDSLPTPATSADVIGWVRDYLAFMDRHGAFLHAFSWSAPEDDEFRSGARRMQMRVAFQLGLRLRARQPRPTSAPEALGLVVLAMLDRTWYGSRVTRLPVDDADMVRTAAALIRCCLTAEPAAVAVGPDRARPAAGAAPQRPADPVLDAARRLFVQRDVADVAVADVVAACGVDRAEFAARFGSTKALFLATGSASLQEVLDAIDGWDRLPRPCSTDDVAGWVDAWFDTLDRHGVFVYLFALAVRPGTEFAAHGLSSLMKVAWALGTRLRSRQAVPSVAPDALGLAVLGMVSDTWAHSRAERLPIGHADLVAVLAAALQDLLTTRE